jgi:outer membrane protein OmpA-like peptidoglycan-associated protein
MVKSEDKGTDEGSNEGNEKHNEKLSVKRAEAVKKYLTQKGIESSRMKTKGLGASNPMAENTSEEGKSLNRRIEFVVTDDGVKNETKN